MTQKSAFSLLLLFFLTTLSACAPRAPDHGRQVAHDTSFLLARDLMALDHDVNPAEAAVLARETLTAAGELTEKYRLTGPPIFHNILVNAGIKERGLCIHWTEDLLARLKELELKTFELHWGVANRKDLLRIEHSSVVVTAFGQNFEDGLVLDPWRDSGRLYWGKVKTDSYAWEQDD